MWKGRKILVYLVIEIPRLLLSNAIQESQQMRGKRKGMKECMEVFMTLAWRLVYLTSIHIPLARMQVSHCI